MSKKKADTSEMLSVARAAGQFAYTRTWLQKLLIAGTLQGEKNEQGHWRVSVEAMQKLADSRQEREAAQNRQRRRKRTA